ncbi:MAG TPA: SDR family NAD(P)-dependent oxidoreductase [Gaiellaceae bacterium]|nr:SDR family NAD(P)-dependent oxidoreductase [Gaiellaceae bacterium]
MSVEGGAFVVGGTAPFGLAVVRELVGRGAQVLLVGPELEALEEVVSELGDQVLPCVADLADAEDAARVGGVAAALLGGVDGVVLAPAALPHGDVLEVPEGDWRASFSQSVWGPLGLLRGLVPLLEGDGGEVLFVLPAGAGEGEAGRVVRAMLEALVEELIAILPPVVRLSRIDADPELAGTAASLLARQ